MIFFYFQTFIDWSVNANVSPISKAPCPDIYGGKFRDCDFPGEDMGKKYAEEVDKIIKEIQGNDKNVCCFIAESMQSCGGQIIYPPGYLGRVYE